MTNPQFFNVPWMFLVRYYSAAAKKQIYDGLRLMDHMRSSSGGLKLTKVPPAEQILSSRRGDHYYHPVEHQLETATVVASYLGDLGPQKSQKQYKNLKKLLIDRGLCDLDEERQNYKAWVFNEADSSRSFLGRILNKYHLSHTDLDSWVRCYSAPNMEVALRAMNGRRWPQFLLLFTMSRICVNKLEAYQAIDLYKEYFKDMDDKYQVEFTASALDMSERHVVEMVPAICQIFTLYASESVKTSRGFNEVIWRISKFGTTWSAADAKVLSQGQKVLVENLGSEMLDKKGFVALAYVFSFFDHEMAKLLVDQAERLASPCEDFPYTYAPLAVRLFLAGSANEALTLFQVLAPEKQTPFMWALLLTALRNNSLLTPDLARKIWAYWQRLDVRLSSLMLQRLLQSLDSLNEQQDVLQVAQQKGIMLKPSLIAQLANAKSLDDYQMLQDIFSQLSDGEMNEKILSIYMNSQAKWDPNQVWNTYRNLTQHCDPSSDALASLCRAAWNPDTRWGSYYAPQLALAEVKKWVRGFTSSSDDVLKIFPTENLVYSFIFMLGTAKYYDELSLVLPWMDAVKFAPSKRTLCALIHFSREGTALLKLGGKVGDAWPTEEEYAAYKHDLG